MSNLQIWKKIPLLRPLLATCIGIIIQYHTQLRLSISIVACIVSLLLLIFFRLLNNYQRFKYAWLNGLVFIILFTAIGNILCFTTNANNKRHTFNQLNTRVATLVTLQEAITEKAKSYKTIANATAILVNNQWQPIQGKILVYFKKEEGLPPLQYGSQIIIQTPLQIIGNAGNPGAFNYREYCLFQGIVRQTFLSKKDYVVLTQKQTFFLNEWMIAARSAMLSTLRKNIANPQQLSIAEALLIGYRDDLDRDLVKAYSNTGVVHIIAISGLHLGMMYGLMLLLFKPFAKFKITKLLKPLTILLVLWGFTFIADAVPSILRSAVMFSFIVMGESFGKRTNIYNNLAASAFVILLFNPFSLWDVGFQLSYAAVLSIVLFSKHINNWFYFNNKILKTIWSLNAVTLSAQILTLPLVIYHFHQFPNLFLITNIVAVPLSALVLYAELLMLLFTWLPFAVHFLGNITAWLIGLLNNFILHINNLSFAVWQNLQITIPQAVLLFLLLCFFTAWFIHKKTKTLLTALATTTLFMCIRCADFIKRQQQHKLIVYNVPQHKAIDIVQGRAYQFIGDSILTQDGFLRNFHLQPSRILHRTNAVKGFSNISIQPTIIQSAKKIIVLINQPVQLNIFQQKIKADVVVISGNPKIYLNQLTQLIDCPIIVADASNSLWKINQWKKDAEALHLRLHSTPEHGAFEMNL